MKRFLSLIFLLCLLQHSYATLIAVGYGSKNILIWRFWEIGKDGQPKPKMLVYNVSNHAATFFLCAAGINNKMDSLRRAYFYKAAHVNNDTVIKPVIIQPHEYIISDIIALKNSSIYYCAFVDDEYYGMDDDMLPIPFTVFKHKYYSREGIGGSQPWITGKDKLFSRRGKKDKMTLYFDYSSIKKDPYLKYRKIQITHVGGICKGFAQTEQGDAYAFDTSCKDMDLHVNVEQKQIFEVTVNFTVTKKDEMPVGEMREVFAGGSAGVLMPVFAQ